MGHFDVYPIFIATFCTKTRDIDSNSQQNVEIDRVAKSLPHFYLILRTAC